MKPGHEPAPRTSGSGSRRPSDSPDGPTRRGSFGPRGVAPSAGILVSTKRVSCGAPGTLPRRLSEAACPNGLSGRKGNAGSAAASGGPSGRSLRAGTGLGGLAKARATRVLRGLSCCSGLSFQKSFREFPPRLTIFRRALRRRRVRPPRRKAGRRRRSRPWRGRPRPSPAGPPGRPGRRRPWRRGLRGARGRRG